MKKFLKQYWFILSMLIAIVAGCAVGAAWPGATCLEPLGTVFINMMFCVAVPMVFCSIASAIANMKGIRRAGKIMGATLVTFLVTAAIAAVVMYAVCRVIPLVTGAYDPPEGEVGSVSAAEMIVNFFTVPDFTALWSRKAMLPLIVAAIIFGFAVQWAGGADTPVAKLLSSLTDCMLKAVKIITYYAPIGFFGFFAYLVAFYGPQLISDYSRTLVVYYVMCCVSGTAPIRILKFCSDTRYRLSALTRLYSASLSRVSIISRSFLATYPSSKRVRTTLYMLRTIPSYRVAMASSASFEARFQ